MKKIQIAIPPFNSWDDARNVLQTALNSLVGFLVKDSQTPQQLDAGDLPVVNVSDPQVATDAATKNYVDSVIPTALKATILPSNLVTLYTSTQGGLTSLTAKLTAQASGVLVYISDYNHVLQWSGSAWDWGPGDLGSGYLQAFDVDPTGVGVASL